jgi:hypothetical protein
LVADGEWPGGAMAENRENSNSGTFDERKAQGESAEHGELT